MKKNNAATAKGRVRKSFTIALASLFIVSASYFGGLFMLNELATVSSSALYVDYTPEQMVEHSDVIFVGKITQAHNSLWNTRNGESPTIFQLQSDEDSYFQQRAIDFFVGLTLIGDRHEYHASSLQNVLVVGSPEDTQPYDEALSNKVIVFIRRDHNHEPPVNRLTGHPHRSVIPINDEDYEKLYSAALEETHSKDFLISKIVEAQSRYRSESPL